MDALADASSARPSSPAEDYILGGDDAPEIAERSRLPSLSGHRDRALRRPKCRWRRKPSRKQEERLGLFRPQEGAAPGICAPSRSRPASAAAPRQPRSSAPRLLAEQPAQPSGDDLFPEHNRDEQFEIPAFLRRQSN